MGQVRILGNRLSPGLNVELLVHAPDVGVHRGNADVEALGDFFVEIPTGEQIKHFLFTGGEIIANWD